MNELELLRVENAVLREKLKRYENDHRNHETRPQFGCQQCIDKAFPRSSLQAEPTTEDSGRFSTKAADSNFTRTS